MDASQRSHLAQVVAINLCQSKKGSLRSLFFACYPWGYSLFGDDVISNCTGEFISQPEPERPILSEYHDGGSPCGIFMLRQGPWKYIYFAAGPPALLFNIDRDPRELHNLADDAAQADSVRTLSSQLRQILDPEEVNRQAFADQAQKIAELGGLEAIRNMPSFNLTPLEQG